MINNKIRALLVGINYVGQSGELNGCYNDVIAIREHLINVRSYDPKHIIILTDAESGDVESGDVESNYDIPNAQNITEYLKKLIDDANKEEYPDIFFHYSGHGTYIQDNSGEEADGKDEALVPVDYLDQGIITDDTLRSIVSRLNIFTKMYALIDACHSGTSIDLKHNYTHDSYRMNQIIEVLPCSICMISGCRDNQTSADAYINGKYRGAMTTSYIKSYEPSITYGELLNRMIQYMITNQYTQRPQISCTHMIKFHDTYYYHEVYIPDKMDDQINRIDKMEKEKTVCCPCTIL